MRVIAGTAKGLRLGPVPAGTRPLSDRAREGLFASLASDVLEARCLDLFAGTGAIGIEALSRGASHCTFVDRSRGATAAIRSNLEKTRLRALAEVVTADVAAFLARPRPGREPYDLVFLDPPYELGGPALGAFLGGLADGWLARGEATVVMTRGHKSPLPAVPLHWATRRQLRYGDSLLFLYREV
ncbi:MAG: 16S rRNA (guanine(966)-N(2))-methyltransferase RsmD [Actinomycetota bacterium]